MTYVFDFLINIWTDLFGINIPILNITFGTLAITTFIIYVLCSYLNKFIRG